jgi:hypothetical protein
VEVIMVRDARATAIVVLSFVALIAGWASAQAIRPDPVIPPITLMGEDIAFRVDTRIGNTVAGRLMVRIDGEWVEADVRGFPTIRRLDSK